MKASLLKKFIFNVSCVMCCLTISLLLFKTKNSINNLTIIELFYEIYSEPEYSILMYVVPIICSFSCLLDKNKAKVGKKEIIMNSICGGGVLSVGVSLFFVLTYLARMTYKVDFMCIILNKKLLFLQIIFTFLSGVIFTSIFLCIYIFTLDKKISILSTNFLYLLLGIEISNTGSYKTNLFSIYSLFNNSSNIQIHDRLIYIVSILGFISIIYFGTLYLAKKNMIDYEKNISYCNTVAYILLIAIVSFELNFFVDTYQVDANLFEFLIHILNNKTVLLLILNILLIKLADKNMNILDIIKNTIKILTLFIILSIMASVLILDVRFNWNLEFIYETPWIYCFQYTNTLEIIIISFMLNILFLFTSQLIYILVMKITEKSEKTVLFFLTFIILNFLSSVESTFTMNCNAILKINVLLNQGFDILKIAQSFIYWIVLILILFVILIKFDNKLLSK